MKENTKKVNNAPEANAEKNSEKKLTRKEAKELKQQQEKAEIKKLAENEYREHLKTTILNKKTAFAISEAYKAARTNIMFSLKDKKECKIIAVTSANPGEGKSTNAINFAVSFAQMGERVAIIDGDMRKPSVHKYFDIKNKKGLSNILGGFESVADCIYHDDVTGLDVITSGHIPPNPAELLSSGEMDTLLETLSGRYDYIIIDTPPVNIVTDVTVLSKKVDGVILIVRHNVTSTDSIERCINTLNFTGAKILGFVINSIDITSYRGKYSYKRMYRRGYKYYSYKRYGYGKYGYGKYGYGKYGYGFCGLNNYSYGEPVDETDSETK